MFLEYFVCGVIAFVGFLCGVIMYACIVVGARQEQEQREYEYRRKQAEIKKGTILQSYKGDDDI